MMHRILTILAWGALATGASLLLFVGSNLYQSTQGHQDGLDAFEAMREARADDVTPVDATPADEVADNAIEITATDGVADVVEAEPAPEHLVAKIDALAAPDMTGWSEKRISDYNKLHDADAVENMPAGIIRIPAVDIELPVFDGTEEYSLTRGAGRIEGTAPLGGAGNTGLAAHRDGYFRALKNIKVGDDILIETLDDDHKYRIVDLSIVYPEDTYVLEPTETDSLTLVTCYPFYFVGSAPQRFIVRAEKL